MSSIGTGYDLSVTTFSPDGRVFQIEYAAKAVDNSGFVLLLILLLINNYILISYLQVGKNLFFQSIFFLQNCNWNKMQRWGRYGTLFSVSLITCFEKNYIFKCRLKWILLLQGVEKLITSKMMLPGSNRRIHSVHRHSGMVFLIPLCILNHICNFYIWILTCCFSFYGNEYCNSGSGWISS